MGKFVQRFAHGWKGAGDGDCKFELGEGRRGGVDTRGVAKSSSSIRTDAGIAAGNLKQAYVSNSCFRESQMWRRSRRSSRGVSGREPAMVMTLESLFYSG